MMDSELNDVDDNVELEAVEDQEIDNLEAEEDALEPDYDGEEEFADDDDTEIADEGEEEEVAEAEPELTDDVMVKLDDGETVSLAELRSGFLKGKDYTHKTTELSEQREQVAEMRKAYEERAQFAETTLQNLTGYLQGLIPPEPPLQLAQQNPAEYQYQTALRKQAMEELGQLVQMGQGATKAQQDYSEQDMARLRADEDAKLVKAMPHLADPAKRAAFDKNIQAAALEFGFTEQEAAGAVDHRMKKLVHYARLGMKAETNRNNAQRRVEAPKKGRAQSARAKPLTEVEKAHQRYRKSGSLSDAEAFFDAADV